MPVTYDYPRPAVTADTVVLAFADDALEVLLIERGHEPFAEHWALPGGFVEMDETLEASARRELAEETGLRPERLAQVHAFGDPGRDPRGRVVTVAFLAMIRKGEHAITAASDAARAEWFAVDRLPRLAFDHDRIIAVTLEHLRVRARVAPIGLELLPATFTVDRLLRLYELVLASAVDREDLIRCLDAAGLLARVGGPGPRLGFDLRRYRQLERDGLCLDL